MQDGCMMGNAVSHHAYQKHGQCTLLIFFIQRQSELQSELSRATFGLRALSLTAVPDWKLLVTVANTFTLKFVDLCTCTFIQGANPDVKLTEAVASAP